jgi:group I intron endonuclease
MTWDNIVYRIRHTVTGQIYFGVTCQSLKQRWRQHCAFSRPNTRLRLLIKAYGRESFEIEEIAQFPTYEMALAEERRLIAIHKTNFCRFPEENGLNTTDGGEAGTAGYVATPSHRKNLSNALKGKRKSPQHAKHIGDAKRGSRNPMFGRIPSQRSRDLAAQRFRGSGNPMRGKFGESNPLFGSRRPAAVKQKILAGIMSRARPVEQLDLSGDLITSHQSTQSACRAVGIKNGVHAVCAGRRKSAGGFRWRFAISSTAEQMTLVQH